MVDVNTQNKTISVNVSSSGVSSNVNASGDTTMYYSNKAREWAISNRIVDGVDYSSKYYAGRASQSALNAQSFAQSAQDSYNNVENSAIKALEDIETDKTSAISEINTTKTNAINSITTAKNSAISDIDTTAKSYDNLTHRQITNCLLEVPQKIKLELNNGILTLKAGSKVIIPNGVGIFDEYMIDSDKTHTQSANGAITVYYNPALSRMVSYYSSADASGTDRGSDTSSKTFYDTDDNKVSRYDGGTLTLTGLSFPLARITVTNGAISTIDQVFNGFGYIGSTIWVDKGVKGLIPNGRNEDGSLKNIEFTTSKVLRASAQNGLQHIRLNASELQIGILYYNEAENVNTNNNGALRDFAVVGNVTGDSNNVITSLQPKQPFRAVDYADYKPAIDSKVSKSGDTMTGNLHIKKNNIQLIFNNDTITTSTNPSVYTNLGNFFIYDKDGQLTGYFQNAIDASLVSTTIGARRKINGTDKTASLALGVDGSGVDYFNFPRCTTKATTTSSARSNKVAVVVENYVYGTSWYRVWSDGWIEQGGQGRTPSTVTLLKSFSNTNYTCVATPIVSTGGNYENLCVQEKTKSDFKIWLASYQYACSWYACGY